MQAKCRHLYVKAGGIYSIITTRSASLYNYVPSSLDCFPTPLFHRWYFRPEVGNTKSIILTVKRSRSIHASCLNLHRNSLQAMM
jgi:hypothetical protein